MAQDRDDESPELIRAPLSRLASTQSIHPGRRPSLVNIPVTPGILVGEYDPTSPSESSSYFFVNPSGATSLWNSMAQTPEAPTGAQSDKGGLHTMGQAADARQDEVERDPRSENPALNLSGGMISATFCIPYSLQHRKGADWTLGSRHGTSALFDSFTYLASDKSSWNHTLVGWTGEITAVEELTPPDTPPATTHNRAPLNKSSAPIPIDGVKPVDITVNDGLHISKEDQAQLERQLGHDPKGKILPVWLADEHDNPTGDDGICLKDQARWRRFAEQELYTMFHYKQHEPTDGLSERKFWADYYQMNQKFANRILEIYKPGDVVMIHDYHLLLLPAMLRQKVPHMNIGFFLHIPFPSSEFLRCLPRRKEILEGILGSNLIAFQSYSYSRHFVSCCTRILGFPSDDFGVDAFGMKVKVAAFPIGIDAAAVEKLAFDNPVIGDTVASLKEQYKGKKIIVGRDRLDSVRGVAQKLMAFERFLERYPEERGNVVLIQVTSPTSVEDVEDPKNKIANKVSELVTNINGAYGSLDFSPVQHYSQYLSQTEYLALLRAADIALITSVRDGMNTTSLEYVVCQRDNHGPLILSEFSGTAGCLNTAIQINPWDLSGVAKSIKGALTMSEEKKSVMHLGLYNHVISHDIHSWSNALIRRLLTVLNSSIDEVRTPQLDKIALLEQYKAASKRLFMFDYDGTLTPIVKNPSDALPSQKLLRTLKALASDHKNAVWIISGRDQEFLQSQLGHISELGFSAEHGSFMRHPGSSEWENLAETFDMDWQAEVFKCFEEYSKKTPGSFIERKRCALTWHYRPSDPELGAHMANECKKELEKTVGKKWDVEVMSGKANLEVRPTFINKGEIAKRLVSAYGKEVGEPPEFTFCLGDDSTDEDMFRSLNATQLPVEHVFSTTVGPSNKQTLAHYHLLEPKDVVSSIALLCGEEVTVGDMGVLAVVEGHIPDQTPGKTIPKIV